MELRSELPVASPDSEMPGAIDGGEQDFQGSGGAPGGLEFGAEWLGPSEAEWRCGAKV